MKILETILLVLGIFTIIGIIITEFFLDLFDTNPAIIVFLIVAIAYEIYTLESKKK